MHRNAGTLYFLVLTLAGLGGCSSQPSGKATEKAAAAPDKIQGKAQIAQNETNEIDAAMNADGPSVYLVEGMHRYRLFFKKPTQVDPGKEYIAEGVNAQKMIDEIGDPDQGKNGYPLESSCNSVVRKAWPELGFDVVDSHTTTLRARVRRYPARPVFLVTQLLPVAAKANGADKQAEDEDLPEIALSFIQPAGMECGFSGFKELLRVACCLGPAGSWVGRASGRFCRRRGLGACDYGKAE